MKKKLLSLICALAMAVSLGAVGLAETTATDTSEQNETQAMIAVQGTYQQLFEGATFDASCDDYWHDAAAAIVGEANADMAVSMMKASVGGTIYGQEAVDAYAENPDAMAFDCGFIGGVATFDFDGTQISGFDASGTELFSHTYHYVEDAYIGEEMGLEDFGGPLWQSDDADSGEFTYFLLLPDTKETTYHIELRYGDDVEALKQYGTGEYAYWMAAGIATEAFDEKSDDAAANDAMLRNVIALFCAENLAGMVSDETTAQRADLAGTWDAAEETLAALRAEAGLENAMMYCQLNADGTGATYVDMEDTGEYVQTGSYTFYAYDNDGSEETKSGVYITVPEESSETCLYDIVSNDAGQTILSLYAPDGTASWVLRAE